MTEKTESRYSATNLRKHKGYVRAYARMVEAASTPDGLLTYGELAELFGITAAGNLMGSVTGVVLGLITDEEREAGRPMLSAVVVSKSNNRPTQGFYSLATQYGLLAEDASESEKRAFWEAELQRVRDAWAD